MKLSIIKRLPIEIENRLLISKLIIYKLTQLQMELTSFQYQKTCHFALLQFQKHAPSVSINGRFRKIHFPVLLICSFLILTAVITTASRRWLPLSRHIISLHARRRSPWRSWPTSSWAEEEDDDWWGWKFPRTQLQAEDLKDAELTLRVPVGSF